MTLKVSLIGLAAMILCGGMAVQSIAAAASLGTRDFIIDGAGAASPDKETGEWKPTAEEAIKAKVALLAYVSEASHPVKSGAERYAEERRLKVKVNFGDYWIQYAGFYNSLEPGMTLNKVRDRTILMLGFCAVPPAEIASLREQLQLGNGESGGACFFRASYSFAERRIMQFLVNHD